MARCICKADCGQKKVGVVGFERKGARKRANICLSNVALQALLPEATREQLEAKVAKLKAKKSHWEIKNDEPTTLYGDRTIRAVELARLHTLKENKTSEFSKLGSVAKESERPAKCAKVVLGVKNCGNAPSTAA